MDPTCGENAPFFTALFRHMQMSAMLGCPSVASEVGKILLSLEPRTDSYNVLLTLDYFLLTSGKHSDLLDFVGISSRSSSSSRSEENVKENKNEKGDLDPWSIDNTDFKKLEYCFSSPLDSYAKREGEEVKEEETIKLCYLPNWWFALALSTFIKEKENGESRSSSSSGSNSGMQSEDQEGCVSLSSECILLKALSIWPYLLQPLLKKAGVQTSSSHWRGIFAHTMFATSVSR